MISFITMQIGIPSSISRLDVRQGIKDVSPNMSITPFKINTNNNSGISTRISTQKVGYKAIFTSGGTSSKAYLLDDYTKLDIATQLPLTISQTVWCCAISEKFYAIGGTTPFLMVFNASNNEYVSSVSTAGLGVVTSMRFSPDESKLVITHETAPHIRVYNTLDWSHVNPSLSAPAGIYKRSCAWSDDGQYVSAYGTQPPYITIYNPDLSQRFVAESSANYVCYDGCTVKPHPLKTGTFIYMAGAGSTANRYPFFDYNINGVINEIIPSNWRIYTWGFGVCKTLGLIYLNHQGLPVTNNKNASIFDLNTYQRIGDSNVLEVFYTPYSTTELHSVERDLHKVSGTVRDISNAPASRLITAHNRETGEPVARTTSDAITGNYLLILPDGKEVDIQFHTADGELLNDLFYARVIPEPMT